MGLIELSLWDKLKRIKADKVVGAVEGNFAKLDANGNLVDSGHKDADYEDADATILKEADVVDSLESTSTTAPLSANQGKVLNDAIDELDGKIDTLEGRVDTTELTLARQGQDLASVKQTLQQGNGATLDFSGIGIVPLDARATGRANPTIEGRTATNLASANKSRWEYINYGTAQQVDGDLVFTSTVNGLVVLVGFLNVPTSSGRKLFSQLRVSAVSTSITEYELDTDGSVDGTNQKAAEQLSPVSGTIYTLKGITTDAADFTGNLVWKLVIRDTSIGDVITIKYDTIAVDLTSIFGAGNEPTEADCAKIFSYFDGTKSIQLPARLRSVGKNLLDNSKWSVGGYFGPDGLLNNDGVSYYNEKYIRVNPSTQYSLSFNGIKSRQVIEYDKDLNVIARTLNNGSTISFTTTSTTAFVRISFYLGTEDTTSVAMFVLGSVLPLEYEPYQDSTIYIADNDELRSVPAISDEVKVVNGQLVKVQRVSAFELSDSDFYELNTSYTNLDYVSIKKRTDMLVYDSSSLNIGATYPIGYPNKNHYGDFDSVDMIGYSSNAPHKRYIWIGFAKGTYATIAEAQADLAGTVIYYQLATPIITPLTTSGTLKAFQNGTVYFEPYYEGSHQTDASSQITLPYEGTIEAVYGYDEDLVEYLLDSSEYSLTGTTLTITDALENEVFFVQMSRSEPLAPEMSVNTLNNEQVIADTSNGKFYKLVPTITNGELVSQTPVEVV